MKSSLTFQMSLHLGVYLIGGFAVIEVAMLVYKNIGKKYVYEFPYQKLTAWLIFHLIFQSSPIPESISLPRYSHWSPYA